MLALQSNPANTYVRKTTKNHKITDQFYKKFFCAQQIKKELNAPVNLNLNCMNGDFRIQNI